MKRSKRLFVMLICSFVALSFTMSGLWKADPDHSELGFEVKHLGISDITGHLHVFEAKMTSTKADFSDAVLEMTAKTNSINTRVAARDTHLKSADFFNAEKNPTIQFKSTYVRLLQKDAYLLKGNLTLAGVTKEVELQMFHTGKTVNSMSKKETLGFKIVGQINRSDFKLGTDFPTSLISDEVKLFCNLELTQ